MAFELRLDAAFAILKVRDSQRAIVAFLKAALAHEKDQRYQLVDAWVIGLLYDEPQEGMSRAGRALSSPNPEVRRLAFVSLGDLAVIPGASAFAPEVLAALARFSTDPDPKVVTEARNLTDRVAMPWAGEAIQLLRSGKPQEAIAPITRYINAVPWQDVGYMVRGQAYLAAGQSDKAAEDLIKAAELLASPTGCGGL
jgi:HEAT repeat protein